MGLPRPHAQLGIISYSGSYFHPKTYHLRRRDSSQAAYVGSANLTLPGITSHHVEAGILLDTKQGDPVSVLNDVAASIDEWFQSARVGLEQVQNIADVGRLTAGGLLAVAPLPRPPSAAQAGSSQGVPPRPRLQPLVRFPHLIVPGAASSTATTPGIAPASGATPTCLGVE